MQKLIMRRIQCDNEDRSNEAHCICGACSSPIDTRSEQLNGKKYDKFQQKISLFCVFVWWRVTLPLILVWKVTCQILCGICVASWIQLGAKYCVHHSIHCFFFIILSSILCVYVCYDCNYTISFVLPLSDFGTGADLNRNGLIHMFKILHNCKTI